MEMCKKFCKECPFLNDSLQGYTGTYTPQELHSMAVSEQPFPCHMSHHGYLTFENAKNYPMCRGRIAYALNNFKIFRSKELSSFQKEITKSESEMVLGSNGLIKYHGDIN